MLFTSMIVGYAYVIEFVLAYYSGNIYEFGIFKRPRDRLLQVAVLGHGVLQRDRAAAAVHQEALRADLTYLFVTSIFVNIGMWLERFVIIITSLAHEFVAVRVGHYKPQPVEISIMIGTFGFFFMMFLLFAKFLPVVAITEKKEEVH